MFSLTIACVAWLFTDAMTSAQKKIPTIRALPPSTAINTIKPVEIPSSSSSSLLLELDNTALSASGIALLDFEGHGDRDGVGSNVGSADIEGSGVIVGAADDEGVGVGTADPDADTVSAV